MNVRLHLVLAADGTVALWGEVPIVAPDPVPESSSESSSSSSSSPDAPADLSGDTPAGASGVTGAAADTSAATGDAVAGSDVAAALPHPFAASVAELRAAVADSSLAPLLVGARDAAAPLWLPSRRQRPHPSRPSLAAALGPLGTVPDRYAWWGTPLLRLTNAAVAGWAQAGAIAFGADLAVATGADVLAAIGACAHEIVVAHEVVAAFDPPGDDGRAVSVWRPFPRADVRARLRGVVAGLPPAMTVLDAAADPAALVAARVAAEADVLVRTWLSGEVAFGVDPPPLPSEPRSALADAWRAALASPHDATFPCVHARHASGQESPGEGAAAYVALVDSVVLAAAEQSGGAAVLHGWFCLTPPADGPDPAADSISDGAPSRTRSADPDNLVWQIEFGLQSRDDPSLVATADDIWAGGGAVATLGRLYGEDPQDRLLAELGRAVRVWPALAAALHASRPARLSLDTADVIEFLQTTAPALEAAAFGVLVPASLAAPAALGLAATVAPSEVRPGADGGEYDVPARRSAAGAGLGLDALVDVNWSVLLGDTELDVATLAELASLTTPLVQVRGVWTRFDADAVAAALSFLRAPAAVQPPSVAQMLALAGSGEPAARRRRWERPHDAPELADAFRPFGVPIRRIRAAAGAGDDPLVALLRGDLAALRCPLVVPDGFTATLRPYQRVGAEWLAALGELGLGACLADDMGLGKTVQVLAVASAQAMPGPTLIVCPTSLLGNWEREAAKFAPDLAVTLYHGTGRNLDVARKADVVLTTYGTAANDADALAAHLWGRVVLDEAQAIKNPQSRAARAVCRLRAKARIALTGTPIENHLGELWSIFRFVQPELLGPAMDFADRYAVPIERERDDVAMLQLATLTAPFLLRRTKHDPAIVPDLPARIDIDETCGLTREQALLYHGVVAELLEQLAEHDAQQQPARTPARRSSAAQAPAPPGAPAPRRRGIQTGMQAGADQAARRRGMVLASMTRLKQICDHPALYTKDSAELAGRSGKLDRLEQLCSAIVANGDAALIFTQFASFAEPLRRHLQELLDVEVLSLTGATRRPDRDRLVARFQSGAAPLFVISLKAGGVGLNLTAANHVIHLDRWWNPAVEAQATDRAHRIGQQRSVEVHRLVCPGTLEDRIAEVLTAKAALAGAVVPGDAAVASLTTDELRDALTLSAMIADPDDFARHDSAAGRGPGAR